MNPFMAQQMGISQVPGVGYVEAAPLGALGDDSAVMMISGLGADAAATAIPPSPGPGYKWDGSTWRATGQTQSILMDVQKWYAAVPWWVWMLVAIGALSAGAYLFRNIKKVT